MLVYLLAVANLVALGLVLYGQERLKNMAREPTEKGLQANDAEHQRRLKEFALFIEKRHRVYAALFRRYRMADGWISALGQDLDPSKFPEMSLEEAEESMERGKVSQFLPSHIRALYITDGDAAGSRSLGFERILRLQQKATRATTKAIDLRACNELYLSEEVRVQTSVVEERLEAAYRSTTLREPHPVSAEVVQGVHEAVENLLQIMRAEIQRGESAPS